MEDKAKQDELIKTLENENYDEEVIKQVREDLEAGLSVDQVSIYKIRRLKAKDRELISKGLRMGMPYDVISDMVSHRYKETQLAVVIGEYAGGTDISVIKDVIKEFRTGHDIKETFTQVKERMANTEEKPAPVEDISEETAETDSKEPSGKSQNSNTSFGQGITSSDFLKSVEMMMATFTNTMQMQFDRMDKREAERKSKVDDSGAEEIFNAKIAELETSLTSVKKELSESYSVMETKDKQIKSLRDELDDKEKLMRDSVNEKDREIQDLREEMNKMRAGNTDNGEGAETAVKPQTISEERVKNASVHVPNLLFFKLNGTPFCKLFETVLMMSE